MWREKFFEKAACIFYHLLVVSRNGARTVCLSQLFLELKIRPPPTRKKRREREPGVLILPFEADFQGRNSISSTAFLESFLIIFYAAL
jgi:hypothetical protein